MGTPQLELIEVLSIVQPSTVSSLAFSTDGTRIVSGGYDGDRPALEA